MEDSFLDALDRLSEVKVAVPLHTRAVTRNDYDQPADVFEQSHHGLPQTRQRPADHPGSKALHMLDSADVCSDYYMDDFDEELMRQPDPNQRLGRARISLQPTLPYRNRNELSYPSTRVPTSHWEMDEHRTHVTHLPIYHQAESPSSGVTFPSSPTYQASQRQHPSHYPTRQPLKASNPDSTALQLSPHFESGVASRGKSQKHRGHTGRPVVQGIELVPVSDLPDRLRVLFPYVCFNAVQSKCFSSIYKADDNFVLSSPTGSGKTAVFELAICRLIDSGQCGTFKIVYMAPTKSLCAERKQDWKARFTPLGLKCEEMTGDSDNTSLYNVRSADIIVTTPEKWDSMTRKWKDHEKLVRLIKLFLIDEVHILNKDRGAALEAVVSRMKSLGSNIRFVALSATVPNSQDIATWLGRNADDTDVPAIRERFGEEFRPVSLRKHVCGYQSNSNAFGFDTSLNKKLPDIITKYSQRKPLMVFCFTRKSCSEAAKFLANWWMTCEPGKRSWRAPQREMKMIDKDLRNTVSAGVAVHHAGLGQDDRLAVEQAYLAGDLSVICCTSTLSVGVNLPCHMVVIKNTVSFEGNQIKEYSDLEVMQMIGRAGRPQYDDSAVAVIMTRLSQVGHYEHMVSGQEQLESCLHLNLVEHLNAEIGLGTIADLRSAKKWLHGTFLRVRLQDNPNHYRIEGDTNGRNLDERLEKICSTAIAQLNTHELVSDVTRLKLTSYGEAMARYYVNMTTMTAIVKIPPKPKPSEILSTIAQAHEFREIRLRAGEKTVYKELNNSPSVRFPVKVDIAVPAHKVTLIIQSVLGGVDTITNETNHKIQYGIDQGLIFQHVHRLVRCIIDCQTHKNDAIGIRNALFLSRSFAGKAWDDSPMILRQIEQLGPVAVRKLCNANISTIEDLERTDPSRIEHLLSKNPPFGRVIMSRVKTFPRLRISVKSRGQPVVTSGQYVNLDVSVELGFLNSATPVSYLKKPVFAILLAETSDGQALHFCRFSVGKMVNASPISFTAQLTRATQSINCYVMCDEIAGTLKSVTLVPNIPASEFQSIQESSGNIRHHKDPLRSHIATAQHSVLHKKALPADNDDEWGDGGIGDDEFVEAAERDVGFIDIDELGVDDGIAQPSDKAYSASRKSATQPSNPEDSKEPIQLENGKWACNHACKDKTKCKHLCCRDGLDKKPRPKKPKTTLLSPKKSGQNIPSKTQSKLDMAPKRKPLPAVREDEYVEHVDLSDERPHKMARTNAKSTVTRSLDTLHRERERHQHISSNGEQEHRYYHSHRGEQFAEESNARLSHSNGNIPLNSESFDDHLLEDLPQFDGPEVTVEAPRTPTPNASAVHMAQQKFFDLEALPDEVDADYIDEDYDQDMLDAALIGADDSRLLSSEPNLFVSEDGTHAFPMSNETCHSTFSFLPENEVELGPVENSTTTSSTLPGTPELRAWLAAEIGHSVELVDFME